MDAYEARFVLSGLGLPGFGLRDVDSGACAVRPRDFTKRLSVKAMVLSSILNLCYPSHFR
jgi:hypothetical protein